MPEGARRPSRRGRGLYAAPVTTLAGTLTGTIDGTIANVAATASAVVGGATPSAAQVDTGIALAVSTIVSGVNVQLKELQAKYNDLVGHLNS